MPRSRRGAEAADVAYRSVDRELATYRRLAPLVQRRPDVALFVPARGWHGCSCRSELCETRLVVPTVVIIDDSDDFLSSATGMLNEEGFRVIGCIADPAVAVAEVRRLRPSVVLLDIQLPTIDGFELAEQLAGIEPLRSWFSYPAETRARYGDTVVERAGTRLHRQGGSEW